MIASRPDPRNVICQTWCPKWGLVTIQAESYDQYNATPLAMVDGSPAAIKQYLLWAVNTRRMTEFTSVARMRVNLACQFEQARPIADNALEESIQALAMPAVVADASARAIYSANPKLVLAQSEDWEKGQLQALPWQTQALEVLLAQSHLEATELWLPSFDSLQMFDVWQQRFQAKHPDISLYEIDHIDPQPPDNEHASLGAFSQTDKRRFVTVWFPTITGSDQQPQDSLIELRLTVRPSVVSVADSESDLIVQHGASGGQVTEIKQALNAWRLADQHGKGEWDTQLRFAKSFQDNSYQLALALADLMARGREFSPSGRLITTGAVNHQGRVEKVAGIARKCNLINQLAKKGDRIVLPKVWEFNQATADALALQHLQQQLQCVGASAVFIDNIYKL